MTVTYQDAVLEQVPATNTTVYTCPAGVNTGLITFANCNCEDATGSDITINIVKSGDTVDVSNQYVSNKSIASGTSDPLSEIVGVVLKTGDFISALAANADRLNLKIAIREIS